MLWTCAWPSIQDEGAFQAINGSAELRGSVTRLRRADDLVKISMNDAFDSLPYNRLVSQRPTQILDLLNTGVNVL